MEERLRIALPMLQASRVLCLATRTLRPFNLGCLSVSVVNHLSSRAGRRRAGGRKQER